METFMKKKIERQRKKVEVMCRNHESLKKASLIKSYFSKKRKVRKFREACNPHGINLLQGSEDKQSRR